MAAALAIITNNDILDTHYDLASSILSCQSASADDKSKATGFQDQIDRWHTASISQVKMIYAISRKLGIKVEKCSTAQNPAISNSSFQSPLNSLTEISKEPENEASVAMDSYLENRLSALSKMRDKSWPGESEQGLKWIFCLNLAMIAIEQERL